METEEQTADGQEMCDPSFRHPRFNKNSLYLKQAKLFIHKEIAVGLEKISFSYLYACSNSRYNLKKPLEQNHFRVINRNPRL